MPARPATIVSIVRKTAVHVASVPVMMARGFKDGMIALRIDTTTGATSMFNTEETNLVLGPYRSKLEAQGIKVEELEQKAAQNASVLAIPTYWKKLDESQRDLS
jgi:hypothetical protein